MALGAWTGATPVQRLAMDRVASGVYPASDVVGAIGRTGLRRLLDQKQARKLRHGWYEVGQGRTDEVSAVLRGGVIGCVSALARRGVWVPNHHDLHVRANSSSNRTKRGPFCREYGRPKPEYGVIDELPIALRHAIRCLDSEGIVVICDSIVNRRLMTMDEIEYQLRTAPDRIRDLLQRCDGRAESGPESMVRFRLTGQNIRVRTQVVIPTVGRVDLLVGDRLILEIDGWEFHGDRAHFQSDRTRDAIALNLGYRTLRLTYADVVLNWDDTNQRILAAVRSRVHLGRV